MNALRPLFPIRSRCLVLIAATGAGVLLSGCMNSPFADTAVDPTSPVAAEVARMSRQEAKLPGFDAIPKGPTDLRSAARYGRDSESLTAAGEAVRVATEPQTWTLQGTDAFAEKARRDAGPQIEPPNPGDAEAYAKALRNRATPPAPR